MIRPEWKRLAFAVAVALAAWSGKAIEPTDHGAGGGGGISENRAETVDQQIQQMLLDLNNWQEWSPAEVTKKLQAYVYDEETAANRTELNMFDEIEPGFYLEAHESELKKYAKQPKLAFSRACEPGKKITLTAVGDILLHTQLQTQGLASNFRTLWSGVAKQLAAGDITYANLEGPVAGPVGASGRAVADPGRHFDNVAYTSYPQFNYHPSLIKDIVDSGIDIVSTANNHAMDRRFLGQDHTIANLRDAGLPFTGTRTTSEASDHTAAQTKWYRITKVGDFTIGWIACAFSTNGIVDPMQQVLRCYDQRDILLEQIRKLKAMPDVDVVIATPHWGVEYQTNPESNQKKLAHDMVEAGATIVFGGHPHVLEPVERVKTSDGREAYVIYSLGNFISGQKGLAQRTAVINYVGLTKTSSGETIVNGIRHLPIYMDYAGDGTLTARPSKGNWEDSHSLANTILSGSNELDPDEAVVTNPDCG